MIFKKKKSCLANCTKLYVYVYLNFFLKKITTFFFFENFDNNFKKQKQNCKEKLKKKKICFLFKEKKIQK